tara:strand:- start:78074 stop:79147 length:1074 start_codon:yes stop_codon:yes gene_type:complete
MMTPIKCNFGVQMKKVASIIALGALLSGCGKTGKIDTQELKSVIAANSIGQRAVINEVAENRVSVLHEGSYYSCEYKGKSSERITIDIEKENAVILANITYTQPSEDNIEHCPEISTASFISKELLEEDLEKSINMAQEECAVPGECKFSRETINGELHLDFTTYIKEDGVILKSVGKAIINGKSPWLTPFKTATVDISSYETGDKITTINQEFSIDRIEVENSRDVFFRDLLNVEPTSEEIDGKVFNVTKNGQQLSLNSDKYLRIKKDSEGNEHRCFVESSETVKNSYLVKGNQVLIIELSTQIDKARTDGESVDACSEILKSSIQKNDYPLNLSQDKEGNIHKIVNGKKKLLFKK